MVNWIWFQLMVWMMEWTIKDESVKNNKCAICDFLFTTQSLPNKCIIAVIII